MSMTRMPRPTLQFLVMGIATVILAGATVTFGLRRIHHPEPAFAYSDPVIADPKNQPENSTIALSAQTHKTKSGSKIRLAWDRSAEPIRRSSYGILYIYDGGLPAKRVLSRRTLDSGSTNYTPATDEITFHLILEKGRPKGESVLVLLGSREARRASLKSDAGVAAVSDREAELQRK